MRELLFAPPKVDGGHDVLSPALLRDASVGIVEAGQPIAGYPGYGAYDGPHRLFMHPTEVHALTTFDETYVRSNGQLATISRVTLPAGHDAVNVSRQAFVAAIGNQKTFLQEPSPDIETGSGDALSEEEFQQYIDAGYTVFDQHNRPLPGTYDRVVQLLGLRNQGMPLGMPTGNGTFIAPGSHPAADVFALRPVGPNSRELAVLLCGRTATEQSPAVWAPPGGFGNNADLTALSQQYSYAHTAKRNAQAKADLEIDIHSILRVATEQVVSSHTTINANLVVQSFLHRAPYSRDGTLVLNEAPTGNDIHGVVWVALSALVAGDTDLRKRAASGTSDQAPYLMWSAHMRGLKAAVGAYRKINK